MSTLDLGKLRFNWRGVYDPASTYEKNDTVKYGADSYACQEGTTGTFDPTKWAKMAEGLHPATQDGDLLTMVNGELTALPMGTPHSLLQAGVDGIPYWGNGNVKPHYKYWTTAQSFGTGWGNITDGWIDLTPTSINSKFLVSPQVHIYGAGYGGSFRAKENSSGSYVYIPETMAGSTYELYTSNQSVRGQLVKPFMLSPNTTSTFRIQLEAAAYSSTAYVNESSYYYSRIWALEFIE